MRRRRAASVVTASPYAPARRAMSRRPAAAVRRAVVRALAKARDSRRTAGGRLITVLVLAVAGFMMASAAVAARGQDLRPNRNTDLIELVRAPVSYPHL